MIEIEPEPIIVCDVNANTQETAYGLDVDLAEVKFRSREEADDLADRLRQVITSTPHQM